MSSRVDDGIVRVPLFGSPVSAPLSYTPVCHTAPLPVCVHPAYRPQLTETAALLNRLAAPLVGLPGAPTRAVQRPIPTPRVVYEGTQRVLAFAPIDFHDPTNPPHLVQGWIAQVALSLVADRPAGAGRYWTADKAQSAVALYLLRRAGAPFDSTQLDQGQDVSAAEQRFAALPAGVRRAWLRTHYTLLRQSRVYLENLP